MFSDRPQRNLERNGFAFAIHARHNYNHSLYSDQAFVVSGRGNYLGGPGGWDYGTHNDMLQNLRAQYDDKSMIGCLRGTLDCGELQLFPFFPWENGMMSSRDNLYIPLTQTGYISKQAAKQVIAYISHTDYTIDKLLFEFVNTGEYDGDVKGGIKILKRVRKSTNLRRLSRYG